MKDEKEFVVGIAGVTGTHCEHFEKDNERCYCCHPDNTSVTEDNCTYTLCPLSSVPAPKQEPVLFGEGCGYLTDDGCMHASNHESGCGHCSRSNCPLGKAAGPCGTLEQKDSDEKPKRVMKTGPSGMLRSDDTGKLRYDLIPPKFLRRLGRHYADGAEEHGVDNWKKAITADEIDRFKQSAWRHFMDWFTDEKDEDHASALFFNVAAWEFFMEVCE
jgi:hypothetical protein